MRSLIESLGMLNNWDYKTSRKQVGAQHWTQQFVPLLPIAIGTKGHGSAVSMAFQNNDSLFS